MAKFYEDVLVNLAKKSDEFTEKLEILDSCNKKVKESTKKLLELIQTFKPNKTVCKICCLRPPTAAVQPCFHGGLCSSCAQRALNRGRCFVCRAKIDAFVTIYI